MPPSGVLHFPKICLFLFFILHLIQCSRESPVANGRSPAPRSTFKLTDHPIRDCQLSRTRPANFALTHSEDAASELAFNSVADQLPSYLTVTPVRAGFSASDPQHTHLSFQIAYAGVPLCTPPVRVHWRKGYLSVGTLPARSSWPDSVPKPESMAWPSPPELQRALRQKDSKLKLTGSKPCLAVEDGTLAPGTRVWSQDHSPYPWESLMISGTIRKHHRLALPLTGELELYQKNPDSKKLIRVKVPQMQENGFLCSNLFLSETDTTLMPEIQDGARLNPEAGGIIFEAHSAFANASLMGLFFRNPEAGSWFGSQVVIYLTDRGGPAYFPPGSDLAHFGLPTIALTRESENLKNLRLDSDVIFHEYGHHLVFKTARDLSLGSVFAIHDGIADFFAYMLNEDPCLGESICRQQNRLCSSENCLRTAENNLTLSDLPPIESLKPNHHYRHSELISALLWDIRKNSGMSYHEGARWAYFAIEYLDYSADFQNMLRALDLAREDLFQNKHACAFDRVVRERGFAALTTSPERCDQD